MHRLNGPAGEFFGTRATIPDFDDDDDYHHEEKRKDADAELDAFERELLADVNDYNEDNEEDANRELFMQMFEKQQQQQQQEESIKKKPAEGLVLQKALERLRKTVKAVGLVPWTYLGTSTVRATTTRIETLVTELHASMNRMQPPGDVCCAALWRAAARPDPWKATAVTSKGLALHLIVKIVEQRYAAVPFSLVVLYQQQHPDKNRVALLADWQQEEVTVLLAIILEGACAESVALGPPDSMHALNALPTESQKTLLWTYVGTTLAPIGLVRGVLAASSEKNKKAADKEKK
jgi:hypothetical protein